MVRFLCLSSYIHCRMYTYSGSISGCFSSQIMNEFSAIFSYFLFLRLCELKFSDSVYVSFFFLDKMKASCLIPFAYDAF